MGLSDEERVSKIYYGILGLIENLHAVGDLGYEISWSDDFKVLKAHADHLWHAFLGVHSNGTYWILGGDADVSITTSSKGPWSVAVSGHLAESRAKVEHERQTKEWAEELNKAQTEKAQEFNPFDGFLDLASLLEHSHKSRKAVYTAYSMTELIAYALRRYHDDLELELENLSKVVSDIQGICFAIFSKDETFAKAYVLHRVLRLVFCGSRNAIFLDETGKKMGNIHHDVTKAMSHETSVADVVAIDKMLGKKPTAVDRVLAALRLSGRRFHYDYQFENLIKAFGEATRKKLAPEFERCKALYDETKKSDQEQYNKDKEREQYVVHGYEDESDVENKSSKKSKKPKKKKKKIGKVKKAAA